MVTQRVFKKVLNETTVSVISRDPPFKEGLARFTTGKIYMSLL